MSQTTEADITKAAVEGITKAVIESIVKPVIVTGLNGLRNLKDTALDVFVNRLSGYVESQYKRHALLNTIVFGNKKKLEDLYLPLTVVEDSQALGSMVEYKIDGFSDDFLPACKAALITDTAGMGKSTLSKFLFLRCIKENKGLPVFVELRQLSKETPVLKFIEKNFNAGAEPGADDYISIKRIERIIKRGGFCFFFDGYDEVPSKEREFVTKDLKDFSEKYGENIFVITSRPESSLAAFPQFSRYSIKPLDKKESYELIRKYDQDGERSHQLIAKLEEGMFSSVEEFLKNPLLTTLLYRCFEYKQQIPLKKHIFYRQVFDALYDWHDSTKDGYNSREKRSNLDQDSFHKILRIVGFISVMSGSVEGDVDTVLGWIRQAKTSCQGCSFSESDFLSDVIKAVPVFVKDGLYYRWSHKSLSEYFAAQYICTEGKLQQDDILTAIFNSGEIDRFSNTLDQIYDIDNAAFQKNLTHPTISQFVAYFDKEIKACDGFSGIQRNELELRLAASFGSELFFLNDLSRSHELRMLSNQKKRHRMGRVGSSSHITSIWALGPYEKNGGDNNYVKFVALIIDGCGVVVDILAAKRDPLVDRLNRKTDPLMKLGSSKVFLNYDCNLPIKVNNDLREPLNRPDVFKDITDLYIFMRGAIINKAKAQEFLSAFTAGEPGLSALTNNLLNGLAGRKLN